MATTGCFKFKVLLKMLSDSKQVKSFHYDCTRYYDPELVGLSVKIRLILSLEIIIFIIMCLIVL